MLVESRVIRPRIGAVWVAARMYSMHCCPCVQRALLRMCTAWIAAHVDSMNQAGIAAHAYSVDRCACEQRGSLCMCRVDPHGG
eukprot:272631-Chlamydomonas_euryale.AAC.1